MKKITILSAIVLSAACISCKQTIDQPVVRQTKALIAYNSSFKTTLNEDWSEDWAADDKLTVFSAAAGSTSYTKGTFEYSNESNTFTLSEGSQIATGAYSYDWYVCYPYMQYGHVPGGSKGYTVAINPAQSEYGSSSHIAQSDLMAGKSLGVAAETIPAVSLRHITTLFKIKVVNNSGSDATINGLSMDATAGGSYITGSFTIDYGAAGVDPKLDASQMGSSKSYLCNVSVTNPATLASGESAYIYLTTAPFTIASGKTLKFTVKGSLGDLVVEKTMTADMTFAAGKYNTATLSYTKPEYVVFTETFGANTVAYASVPSYNKAGLTTLVPEHKANYTYAAAGNASFAMSTGNNGGINNPNYAEFLEGAAVKLPAGAATAANSAISIKGITVEANTTYIFKYNKSKGSKNGADYDTKTVFRYREGGTTEWTNVNETAEAGLIEQEFTTGNYTTLDITVEATERNPASPAKYPAVDLFRLIRK